LVDILIHQIVVIGPAGKAVPVSRPERISKTAVPLVSAMPPAIRQPNRCLLLKQDAGQTL